MTSFATGATTTDGQPQPSGPRAAGVTSFAQMLVDSGVVSDTQLAGIQAAARNEQMSLGSVLVRENVVASNDLAVLYAMHFRLAMVDLRSQPIEPEAVKLLPEALARKYQVLPIKELEGRLQLAMTDPTDLRLLEDLAVRTGTAIEPVIVTPEDLKEQIDNAYRLSPTVAESPTHSSQRKPGESTAMTSRDSLPAHVIDTLVRQAIQNRASDIHIEPTDQGVRVRYRIDGILHDVMSLHLDSHETLISRLKIMSGMNIAEKRRPQDGQFSAETESRKVDVRVAVSSTVTGEMAVLRLLDKRFTLLGLDQLGMTETVREQYRRLLRLPYGMLIVCGPTGAGKSTTLYASVLQMNRMEQNVISLEDPVEYRISDINQMQVHVEAGVTFATQLRSVLRLDPDVIVVGEIRDQETAVIATQAALTGHLVLTSLHANDAVAALLRLRDLGVAPYLIASSVAGIVSQRMVRLVCSSCATLVRRPIAEQRSYAAEFHESVESFIYGAGCNSCAHTGYHGRIGVFEVLTVSDSLRQLFLENATSSQLHDQALKEGMVPLRRDGMLKVKQAVTTPYEIMRVMFSLD